MHLASPIAVGLAALLLGGCAGPCETVRAERRALAAVTAHAAEPHARVQLPYAIANKLIAEALVPPPELPVPLDRLGPLAALIGDVRAVPREVVLGPAGPGRVHVAVAIDLHDRHGPLLGLRGAGDLAPVLTHDGRLAIALDARALSRLEPELGDRATEQVGKLLAARLPPALRERVPHAVIGVVAAAVVEQGVDHGYRALRATLLPRLGERTRIEIELPDLPLDRVELASRDGALELAVHTTLPIAAGVGAAPAPPSDAFAVQLAGPTVTAAANWGIANGRLPARYTRKLKPAADGAYVPHFAWRPRDAVRPLVVHMFKLHGGCAHFAAGVQPHVEVRDGKVRGWVTNKELEHADGPLVLELLARLDGALSRSRSKPKQRASSLRITVGDREVTTTLVRAAIAGDELHAALAVSIGRPEGPADLAAQGAAARITATPAAARASRDTATAADDAARHDRSARLARTTATSRVDAWHGDSCTDRDR